MSVRRETKNRRTLFRNCGICGRSFVTTADTPWVRQIMNLGGKKQKTCYFCSEKCFIASYKHIGWYDGKTEERRKAREAERDTEEKNRRYYQTHEEQERQRARERYWADPERAREDQAYQRRKRRVMKQL